MPMELEGQRSASYEDTELHVALHRGGGQIRTGDESQFAIGDSTLGMNGSRKLSRQGTNMTWNKAGEVTKDPKGMVIKDGAYVGLD